MRQGAGSSQVPKPVKKHSKVKEARPRGEGWVKSGTVLHAGEQCEWWVNHSGDKMKEKFVPKEI